MASTTNRTCAIAAETAPAPVRTSTPPFAGATSAAPAGIDGTLLPLHAGHRVPRRTHQRHGLTWHPPSAAMTPLPIGDPAEIPLRVSRWRAAPNEGAGKLWSRNIGHCHSALRPDPRPNRSGPQGGSQGHRWASDNRCGWTLIGRHGRGACPTIRRTFSVAIDRMTC